MEKCGPTERHKVKVTELYIPSSTLFSNKTQTTTHKSLEHCVTQTYALSESLHATERTTGAKIMDQLEEAAFAI
jgi:hypothetical protein